MIPYSVKEFNDLLAYFTSTRYHKADAIAKQLVPDLLEQKTSHKPSDNGNSCKLHSQVETLFSVFAAFLYRSYRLSVNCVPKKRYREDMRHLMPTNGIYNGLRSKIIQLYKGS